MPPPEPDGVGVTMIVVLLGYVGSEEDVILGIIDEDRLGMMLELDGMELDDDVRFPIGTL